MEFIIIIKAIVMGFVEGVTELLPISSTGHLILAGELMNFMDKDKRVVFEIFIQMCFFIAILAPRVLLEGGGGGKMNVFNFLEEGK